MWEYDPTGLRVLLSSSYKMFGQKCQSIFAKSVETTVGDIANLYQEALKLPADLFDAKMPAPPRVPPPVALGQTIALDMKGSWWKSWWFRRRGYQAYAANFHELIEAETSSLIENLRHDQAEGLRHAMEANFEDFINAQCEMVENITAQSSLDADKLDRLFDRKSLEQRHSELTTSLRHLEGYC